MGSKSANRMSDKWSPNSDSLSSKTYDGLSSDISRNTAIPMFGNRGLLRGRIDTFPGKISLDLTLDPGMVDRKFGDASYYMDRMHKEQTNRQTFFFIYIDGIGSVGYAFDRVRRVLSAKHALLIGKCS